MTQRDGLDFGDAWQVCDISVEQAAQMYSKEAIDRTLFRAAQTQRSRLNRIGVTALACALLPRLDGNRESLSPFVTERNAHVLRTLDALQHQAQPSHTAVVYGSQHIPGLSSGLIDRGYRVLSTQSLAVL